MGTLVASTAAMPSRNYTELIAWQKAMVLLEAVYKASAGLPMEERFGLVAQIRRAAVSIPANIAEGEGRRSRAAFLNHLSIAYGSLREVETLIHAAHRLGYFTQESAQDLLTHTAESGRLINGLSAFLRQQ